MTLDLVVAAAFAALGAWTFLLVALMRGHNRRARVFEAEIRAFGRLTPGEARAWADGGGAP